MASSPCDSRPEAPARARPDVSRRDRRRCPGANPIDSLDWPDYVGAYAEESTARQPQRPMTSATGSPAASAAISNTRACGGRNRGIITAPAAARSCPGP